MESDYCDVVSTNRSQHSGGAGMGTGTKATSTPRSNYRVDDFDPFDDRAMSKDSIQSRPLGGVGGNGVLLSVATILPPPTCSMCGGDVGDFLSASNGTSTVGMTMTPGDKSRDKHRDSSSSSSNDRRVPEALVCLDCRARSRREKKLLNRLPKQAGTTHTTHSSSYSFNTLYQYPRLIHTHTVCHPFVLDRRNHITVTFAHSTYTSCRNTLYQCGATQHNLSTRLTHRTYSLTSNHLINNQPLC